MPLIFCKESKNGTNLPTRSCSSTKLMAAKVGTLHVEANLLGSRSVSEGGGDDNNTHMMLQQCLAVATTMLGFSNHDAATI